MKKILFLLLLSMAGFSGSKACDICGCGVGGYYIGILPDFSQKIMGLRYRYSSLKTHIGAGGMQTYLTSEETYRTVEWWGGWNIGKRFRLMATIPYSFNERENQSVVKQKNGLGDISLTGFYRLINAKKMIGKKLLVQSMFVGAGIKLPTGKYNPADKTNTNQDANLFQLGTASVDYTLNMMYDVRIQDIGLNLNSSYKINSNNKYDYRYGNKLSANMQLYYKYRLKKKCQLSPNAGLLYEYASKDTDRKFKVDISGGRLLYAGVGLEAAYKKIALGMNWQKPLSQDLANGTVKAGNRAMLHLAYAF